MARPFMMPDPNDRSYNDPAVIVSPQQVLGIVNQNSKKGKKALNVTQEVRDEFERLADDAGWDNIEFIGQQCMLKVTLPDKKRKVR